MSDPYSVVAGVPMALQSAKKALAHDWSLRTLSDAHYKKFLDTGKMPKGLQGWRPLKAFTPKMLATGLSPLAKATVLPATALMIGAGAGELMRRNLPISDHVSGRSAGRAAFNDPLKINNQRRN